MLDITNRQVQVFNPDLSPKFSKYLGAGQSNFHSLAVCCKYYDRIVTLETVPSIRLSVYSLFDPGKKSAKLVREFTNPNLKNPKAIATNLQGKILVADAKLMQVLLFNEFGGCQRRISCPGLVYPSSIETVGQDILISDYLAHQVMVYDYSGTLLRKLGGPGICTRPLRVLLSSKGQIIVADRQDRQLKVTVFTNEGRLVGTIKTKNIGPVKDVALAQNGKLIVTSMNYRIYFLKTE